MNGLLEDFARWLASQCDLAFGTDIRLYQFAQTPGTASYVTNTGGTGQIASAVLPATVQVMTKAATPRDAMARAWLLYNAIYPAPARLPVRMVNLSDNWRAISITAIQPPYDLGVIDDDERQAVFNLQIRAVQRIVQMES